MFSDTKKEISTVSRTISAYFRELNGNFWCGKQSISLTALSVAYVRRSSFCTRSAGGLICNGRLWGSCFFSHTSAVTNTYWKKGMIVITWLTNMKNMHKHENYRSSWERKMPYCINVVINKDDKGAICLKQKQRLTGKAQVDNIRISICL